MREIHDVTEIWRVAGDDVHTVNNVQNLKMVLRGVGDTGESVFSVWAAQWGKVPDGEKWPETNLKAYTLPQFSFTIHAPSWLILILSNFEIRPFSCWYFRMWIRIWHMDRRVGSMITKHKPQGWQSHVCCNLSALTYVWSMTNTMPLLVFFIFTFRRY